MSVKGIIAARAAFKALPENTRLALSEATEKTVLAVRSQARARVPVDSGSLRDHIEGKFNPRTGFGKVGVTSGRVAIAGTNGSALTRHGARVVEPRRYAHMVEFGTTKMGAQPFMLPAAEGERAGYANRLKAAGRKLEQQVHQSSMRGGGLL